MPYIIQYVKRLHDIGMLDIVWYTVVYSLVEDPMYKIKEILDERGHSPYWLAKHSQVSERAVYKLLREETPIDKLRYGTVLKLAAALDCEIEDLR